MHKTRAPGSLPPYAITSLGLVLCILELHPDSPYLVGDVDVASQVTLRSVFFFFSFFFPPLFALCQQTCAFLAAPQLRGVMCSSLDYPVILGYRFTHVSLR